MCTFVVVGLPRAAPGARVRARFPGWAWRPIANESLRGATHDRFDWFHAVGGLCECDTPLGSATRTHDTRVRALPPHAKDWTATKRERWLAQRDATRQRNDRERGQGLATWRELIFESVSIAGEVALVVRDFDGPFETPFDVRETAPLAHREVTDATLYDLAPDRVHVFR